MTKHTLTNKERGASALFIVVFFAILTGIIALSFTRIAVQDQQAAINNDLAQSAYDSAEAGTQDGIRIVQNYRQDCVGALLPLPSQCAVYEAQFTEGNDGKCNLHNMPGITAEPSGEVILRTNVDDAALEQAYSCVKVATQTSDYRETAVGDKSYLVPLTTVANTPISSVVLNWFSDRQLGSSPLTFYSTPPKLPRSNQWGTKTPPIMRVQLIAVDRTTVNIDNIDADARVVFLYPTDDSGSASIDMTLADQVPRGEKVTAPTLVNCSHEDTFNCSATLTNLPTAGPSYDAANTDYYLRISPKYNNADFQVVLTDASGTIIKFDKVQLEIDSTGRANDLFRRLHSRIRLTANPDFLGDNALDVTQGICKDFTVSSPIASSFNSNCPDQLIKPY